jgi:putative endonuclease
MKKVGTHRDILECSMQKKYMRMIEGMADAGAAEWSVYILRCGDGSLYTGIAKNITLRLAAHQSGRGAAYTRTHLPVKLIYKEEAMTRSQALIREAAIKRLPRPKKKRLIAEGRQFKPNASVKVSSSSMRFSKALPLLFEALKNEHVEFALIGGLALYTLGASRSTFDADFMMFLSQAEKVKGVMENLGYRPLQESKDVANYVSDDPDLGQVDFLFAHRPYAMDMMKRARPANLLGLPVNVLAQEDLIGLKVQSSSNDSERRAKDAWDIEEIMRHGAKTLDWKRIAEYYKLFERDEEFQALKKRFS